MFISTIIPTIGRNSLSRAVLSVLEQKFNSDDFEVIVVNDSGADLPNEEWQKSHQVKVIQTNRHNRSIARNTGAAVARGRYFHFLDDDDYILPGTFDAFWEATHLSQAAWIVSGFQLVDNSGETIVEVFPDEAGNCFVQLVSWEWLPLQASIIEANSFFKVGGFTMLDILLGGFEDIDLSRKIAAFYDFLSIPTLSARIRFGDIGSTTNYETMFIQNRQSREIAFNSPGAFSRLISSAQKRSSRRPYWHGRIIYNYLGSTIRNLRDKRLFTSFSRLFYAIICFIYSTQFVSSGKFWSGLMHPHYSRVWLSINKTGKVIYSKTIFR